MGFGHRVYRAEDPRARVLRRTARELGAPRYEVAEALEQAALAELRERRPDRVLETNVEFWAAIVLDYAEVPATMFTSMFTCARTGGWSAHILEQKRTGRLIRPSAIYTGPATRKASEVDGWNEDWAISGAVTVRRPARGLSLEAGELGGCIGGASRTCARAGRGGASPGRRHCPAGHAPLRAPRPSPGFSDPLALVPVTHVDDAARCVNRLTTSAGCPR